LSVNVGTQTIDCNLALYWNGPRLIVQLHEWGKLHRWVARAFLHSLREEQKSKAEALASRVHSALCRHEGQPWIYAISGTSLRWWFATRRDANLPISRPVSTNVSTPARYTVSPGCGLTRVELCRNSLSSRS